jgi:hypothetical protein
VDDRAALSSCCAFGVIVAAESPAIYLAYLVPKLLCVGYRSELRAQSISSHNERSGGILRR